MKILYVINGTDPRGGANKSLKALAAQLLARGVEVAVVCPDRQGVFNDFGKMGAEVYALPYRYNLYPAVPGLKPWLKFLARGAVNRACARRLARLCVTVRPDIIHTNTTANDIGYLAAKKLRLPHVWHVREYGMKDFGMKIPGMPRRLTAPGNYAITITRDLAADKGLAGLPTARTIYNGVVGDAPAPAPMEKEDYFLYAGRIEPAKGLGDLVDAFLQFCEDNPGRRTALKIAGSAPVNLDGGFEQSLKERIAASPHRERVEWLGDVDPVAPLMARALAVVVPSHCEGFGRVMPEAMAQGAIVAGRDTGGTKEQMDNGLAQGNGEIALRFRDAAELARILGSISPQNIGDFAPMARRAAATVARLYTARANADQVMEFYDGIMAKKW